MPISKETFNTRWPVPVKRAMHRGTRRAIRQLVDAQAGTLVTWAAMVSAIGAAFVAAGLVEYSLHPHGSPFANALTIAGFTLLIGAVLVGLWILVELVRGIVGRERWKAHVTQFAREGQLLRDRLHVGESIQMTELQAWYTEVRDALIGDDPTGAAVVGFEDAVPLTVDPRWFSQRVARLMDYLRRLP